MCSLQGEEVRVSEKLTVTLSYFYFNNLMCSVQIYIYSVPTLLVCVVFFHTVIDY